ncbi:MAG TPA: RsmE family RNA methyltransferase [Chitinophagales bacterium]|nr:RsmE family RNA methyltransferase [Chitinophagales bacterium]HNM33070.1 RsmE family RNA methyltransferase [Chitinophagales bacterium]
MKRFYSPNIQANFIYLEDEEAQHCTKVLRCKTNDKIEVLNGSGILYQGVISNIQKNEVQVEIEGILKQENENKQKLSIAICPTKNPARLEWFLEKATEIGIAAIYPILSERTEKETIKQERLQQIIVSAAKQSGQLYFPVLHPIQPFKKFISEEHADIQQHFIAHCEAPKKQLKSVYEKDNTALILIGPEGDFTPTEIQAALNRNYIPVSLGNSILRVETAGIVACTTIQLLNDES